MRKYINIITESLLEAAQIRKCPNCGSYEIFSIEMPSFRSAKKINNKKYEVNKPSTKGEKLYNCSSCGFVWTDKYDHDKYSFK